MIPGKHHHEIFCFDIILCTTFCENGLLSLLEKKYFPMATVAIGDVSIAAIMWKNVPERKNISVKNFLKS